MLFYPVFGQHFCGNGTDHGCDSTKPVRHAHENAGIAWRYIQMIDIKPCTIEKFMISDLISKPEPKCVAGEGLVAYLK